MKHSTLLAALFAAITLTSCTSGADPDEQTVITPAEQGTATVRLSFRLPLSVQTSRAALTANDKALTDLYVFDFVDGEQKQLIHQVSADADFAEPELALSYGTHDLRVIATRSSSVTLDDAANTTLITFGKTSDTFATSLSIVASAGTSGTHVITLDRITARLQMLIKDIVPSGATKLVTEVGTFYNSLDPYTLAPSKAPSHHSEVSLSSIVGKSEQSVYIFSLAPITQWKSDVRIAVLRADDTAISDFTLTDVPLSRNHTTVISGEFFNRTNSLTFSVNDAWDEDLQYNF